MSLILAFLSYNYLHIRQTFVLFLVFYLTKIRPSDLVLYQLPVR